MQKFKVGDKVRELSTGDIGTIADKPYLDAYESVSDYYWVKWSDGGVLWISKDEIELVKTMSAFETKFMEYILDNMSQLSALTRSELEILKNGFEAGYNSKE